MDKTGANVYATLLKYPNSSTFTLGAATPTDKTIVTMLGYPNKFNWVKRSGGGITIKFPTIPFNQIPSPYAWVLKLQNLSASHRN